jgi:hypothetical protein
VSPHLIGATDNSTLSGVGDAGPRRGGERRCRARRERAGQGSALGAPSEAQLQVMTPAFDPTALIDVLA